MLPKFESIFIFITTFWIIQYKFKSIKNAKKLLFTAINLLIYYLIVKVDYTDHLLIINRIILNIIFKVSKKIKFANDDIAKSEKEIKPAQYILKQLKN